MKKTVIDFIKIMDMGLVRCIDAEGVPSKLKQVSIVDSNEKCMIDITASDGNLNNTVKKQLQSILAEARFLIGFNVTQDLMALLKYKIKVPKDIVIVDVYETYMRNINNVMKDVPSKKNSLQGIAEAFDIVGVTGYHNSLVDASVTMKLFWKMHNKTKGQFVLIKPERYMMTEAEMKEFAASVPPCTNEKPPIVSQKEVTPAMEEENLEYMNYSEPDNTVIVPANKHMYEAVLVIGKSKKLIRMTRKEYRLFLSIRETMPLYPLSVFYKTILAPAGIYNVEHYDPTKVQEESDENMLRESIGAAIV